MKKHTPIHIVEIDVYGNILIRTIDDLYFCKCSTDEIADHIVRCVNNHGDIMRALKRVQHCLKVRFFGYDILDDISQVIANAEEE